jgi:hypothetical protein
MELTIPSHLTSRTNFQIVAYRTEMFQEHKSFANIDITNAYAAVFLQLGVLMLYIHLALRVNIDGPAEISKSVLFTLLLLLSYGISKAAIGRVDAEPDVVFTPLEWVSDILQEKALQGLRAITTTFVVALVHALRVAVSEGLVEVEMK